MTYSPYGIGNGYKIYLSPARHSDTGSRGECGGNSENAMAAIAADSATNGDYHNDVYNPGSSYRNLRARSYQVRISDGTIRTAIDNSNAWGANIHIPMHSNASAGACTRTDASKFGTVAIYRDGSSAGQAFAGKLLDTIGASSPGTHDYSCKNPGDPCTIIDLGELREIKAVAGYSESEFHTWNSGIDWINSPTWPWRFGWAVDSYLGYPRMTLLPFATTRQSYESALSAYPGFGHNAASDEARFDREALAREKIVANCMKNKGYSYKIVTGTKIDNSNPGNGVAILRNQNIAYAESLDPKARAEYYVALYGVTNPNSSNSAELFDHNAPGGGGCSGIAFATIFGVFHAVSNLNEEFIDLNRSIRQHPRLIAAEHKWSACMAARHYAYSSHEVLFSEMDRIAPAQLQSSEIEQRHKDAVEMASTCDQQSGFDLAFAGARAEQESDFVRRNRALLDQHVERLRKEEVIMDKLLGK